MARIETPKQKMNRLFTSWVRELLHIKKLRERDLADFLGVSQQSISRKMNGDAKWTLEDMTDICKFFGESYTIAP